MKTATILRITSIVALIQSMGHFMLFVTAVPANGKEEISLVGAMNSHHFRFGGIIRHSYWDLYFGYGLLAVLTAFIQAVLFWQLGKFAKTASFVIRPVTALFIFAIAIHAVLIGLYFSFLIPIVFDTIIIGLLILAFAKAQTNENGK
jgi:hypothetical protein